MTNDIKSRWLGLPPLGLALIAQVISLIPVLVTVKVTGLYGISISLQWILLAQGMFAAALSYKLRLAPWWVPIQLVLPAALVTALSLAIPGWVYLALFILLALVFWNSAGDRVPLYLTNPKTWAAIETLLPNKPEKLPGRFIDLGCGIGGILLYLSRSSKNYWFEGIESAPGPFILCWLRMKLSPVGKKRLLYGSLWNTNLADYDVVYCFLSPEPMPELFIKAKREMQPGSLLISNSFEVPGEQPDQVIDVGDKRQTRLMVWKF